MKLNFQIRGFLALAVAWLSNGIAWHASGQSALYTYDFAGNPTAVIPVGAAPPTITAQPSSQLLEPSGPVTFSVVASGPGNAYQWFANGAAIPGATNDSLMLANLSGTNFPTYTVRVSNSSGSVTSSPAAIWPDANGNGLPDWWEIKYFGNLNQTASGDFDGDGVSNFDEYVEGTNPADPTSFNPRLTFLGSHGSVAVAPLQPFYTNGQFVSLRASPDPGHNFLGWSGSISGTKAQIAVIMDTNKVAIADFGLPLPFALDNSSVVWITGGDAPWFGQVEVSYDGIGAAQSGPIVSYYNLTNQTFQGEQSWLQTTISFVQAMQLSFWWNVSSRPPDAVTFAIDSTAYAMLSGEAVGWQYFQTNLPAGNHVLNWTYTKGPVDIPTGVPFTDSAWVDQVSLAPANTPPPAPILGVQLTSTNTVLVSWPAPSTGFSLQNSSVLQPSKWLTVTNPISVVGSQNQVIVLPAGVGEFYRLVFQ